MSNNKQKTVPEMPAAAELKKILKDRLKPLRYEHSLGVADTAMCLACRWGADIEKAYLAGLLHDWAKALPESEQEKLCRKKCPEVLLQSPDSPAVWHGPLAAALLPEELGVRDPEILSAIACHTTGKPGMSLLDKIVFLADYIEPGRDHSKRLPEYRRTAFEDLDRAVLLVMEETLRYLEEKKKPVDEMSRMAYDDIKGRISSEDARKQ